MDMEVASLHLFLLLLITVSALLLIPHGSEAFSSAHRCTRPWKSSSLSSSLSSSWSLNACSSTTPNEDEELLSHHGTISSRSLLNRRDAIFKTTQSLSTSAIVMVVNPSSSSSSSSTSSPPAEKVYLRGTVTLQPGQSLPSSMEAAALYITVRPNVPDDAPRAILDGTRGKSPPVLSARFPIAIAASSTAEGGEFFPFEFELTQQNLTPEGAFVLPAVTTEDNESDASLMLWWEKNGKDLIVSARLDTDGVASTRDPDDLVGRGISTRSPDGANENATNVATASIELRGRGLFGKSVTARK